MTLGSGLGLLARDSPSGGPVSGSCADHLCFPSDSIPRALRSTAGVVAERQVSDLRSCSCPGRERLGAAPECDMEHLAERNTRHGTLSAAAKRRAKGQEGA